MNFSILRAKPSPWIFGIALVSFLMGGTGCLRKSGLKTDDYRSLIEGDIQNIEDERIKTTVVLLLQKGEGTQVKNYFCSGFPITPRVVITAAHCLTFAQRATVIAHREKNGDRKLSYEVSEVKFLKDKNYSKSYPENKKFDIAALILKNPIDLNSVKIARLPDIRDPTIVKIKDDPNARNYCYPYAQTGAGNHGSEENPESKIKLTSATLEDGEFYADDGKMSHGPLLATLGKTDRGDSGGPLFVRDSKGRWTVIGNLVGLDYPRKNNQTLTYSLYVPLFDHMDFLNDLIKNYQ